MNSYYRDKEMLNKLKLYYESKLKLIYSMEFHLNKKGNLSTKQNNLVNELHKQIINDDTTQQNR